MTPADLSATLARLGISQAEAARLLGVTPGAVTRWVQGKRAVPGPVVRLLKYIIHQHERPREEWHYLPVWLHLRAET